MVRPQARERLPLAGSADTGAIPEPTVKVRMRENEETGVLSAVVAERRGVSCCAP